MLFTFIQQGMLSYVIFDLSSFFATQFPSNIQFSPFFINLREQIRGEESSRTIFVNRFRPEVNL